MSIVEVSSNHFALSRDAPLARHLLETYKWYSPKFSPRELPRFADVASVTENPAVMRELRDFLVQRYKSMPEPPTHVIGFEARGFVFGSMIAVELGVPFVLMRKAGKNAGVLIKSEPYEKEYKEESEEVMTIRCGSITKASRVLLIDDVLATGGTAISGLQLVEASGATVVEIATIVGIQFCKGVDKVHAFGGSRYKDVKILQLVDATDFTEANCGDDPNYNGPRVISCVDALKKL